MNFPDHEKCLHFLVSARWNGEPICPYCGSRRTTRFSQRFRCYACNTSFSATVGTLFHNSHLSLDKWFRAIVLLNTDKKIPLLQLARELNVNKNTAYRIRLIIDEAITKPEQRKLVDKILACGVVR